MGGGSFRGACKSVWHFAHAPGATKSETPRPTGAFGVTKSIVLCVFVSPNVIVYVRSFHPPAPASL